MAQTARTVRGWEVDVEKIDVVHVPWSSSI
jgi:hypothetical protein